MELVAILSMTFFLSIGVSVFYPHRVLEIIYGVAALLLGALALLGAASITF